MEQRKLNYGIIITLASMLITWGVTFGICQNKIENNTREIERLEQYQLRTDTSMQSIYSQLAGLNAKMDLLLDGRVRTGE